MGATVFHSLTATTPDDPAFEIRPIAHWNNAHVVSVDTSLSNINISAGATSNNLSALTFANSNGVSWGLSANSVLTATVKTDYQTSGAYLTTAALSGDSSKYAGINGAITGGSITVNTSGVSVNLPAYLTTADLSANSSNYARNWKLTGNSAGTQSSAIGTDLWLAGGNGVTLSGTSNSISFSVATNYQAPGAYLTTARASTDALGLATAGTNITWTANSAGVSINAAGYAGTATTMAAGLSATLNSVGLNLSIGAYLTTADLSQNSSLYAGTGTSATNASITLNTAGLQISVPNQVAGAPVTISSFVNLPSFPAISSTLISQSTSRAIAFNMPQAGSFSFLRIPVIMVTATASIVSAASLTSGGAFYYSTWNAVVYSMGTGASSKSLVSYASGSNGWTVQNSYSFSTANSAWSMTEAISAHAIGGGVTQTTQYSQTSVSGNMSSGYASNFSSLRFIDIEFATSMSAGPYWLIIGHSSSSTTSGQGGNNFIPPAGVSYSANHVITQINSYYNAMGDTAGSSGGYLGAGSFTTGGAAGTTSILPISAISSASQNAQIYFQLLRSA